LKLNTGATPGGIDLNYQDLLTGDGFANGVSATVGIRKPVTGGKPHVLLISHNGTNSLVGDQKAIKIGVPIVTSITRMNPNPISAGDMEFLVTFDHPVTGVDVNDFSLTTTGNITGAVIDHIHSTSDPAVWQVHIRSGVGSGTLKVNLIDNDTILSSGGAKLGGVGTGNGSFTNGEVYNVVQPPPEIQGINIDDGTAQRSSIRLLQVIFDWPVVFAGNPANAFVITGPNGVIVPTVDLTSSTPTQTVARLTFSGPGTNFGSLADGEYTLRVLSANVSTGGVALDGDGDGQPGGDYVTNFHRFFGDYNGDRQVDIADFGQFNLAYGSNIGNPTYRAFFDWNNDGVIDIADFGQFSIRIFTPFP
jgi:hypothetical protein